MLGRTLRRKQSAMIVNGVFDRLTKIGIETGRLRIPNFAVMSVARRDATKAKKDADSPRRPKPPSQPTPRRRPPRPLRLSYLLVERWLAPDPPQ